MDEDRFPDFGLGPFLIEPLPVAIDQLEKRMWLDLWMSPVLDAIDESWIEVRRYGSVQAMVAPAHPETPLLNLLLGASQEGVVEDGSLQAALSWVESWGVDCRVPVASGRPEAKPAEELLSVRGYERTDLQVRWVRDASPPGFPEPPGTEVDELPEELEGFSDHFVEGYGLPMMASCFFDCLPGRVGWRCYFVFDEEEVCVGAAAMLAEMRGAQLAFATVKPQARGRGHHMALLHRQISDAAAAECAMLVAETTEQPGAADPSPAARSLVSAGFKQDSVRAVWRRSQREDAQEPLA